MIGETGDQPNSDLWGVRLAGPVPVDGAPARVEALSRFDIVWLREADRLTDAAFTALIEAVAERGCGLFCEASPAPVDPRAAAVSPALRVGWLVDAADIGRADRRGRVCRYVEPTVCYQAIQNK